MAWNPSGTHLAIGYTGATMEENWAATIVARDGFGEGTRRRLRCLKHTKCDDIIAAVFVLPPLDLFSSYFVLASRW